MTSNNAQTLRNFDDFKNMFKGIDCYNCVPGDVAHRVLLKVKLEHDQSRYDDVCMWVEFDHFSKIKRNFRLSDCVPDDNDTGIITVGGDIYSDHVPFDDESEVSDIED